MRNILLITTFCIMGLQGAFAQKEPMVLISTSYGDMKVKLYNETPLHRDNFLELARSGKFDGSIFHRVINQFMIQGGGSQQGAGTIDGRPEVPAEFVPKYVHTKGSLAAARMGDNVNPQKKSSGSQFYIVHGRKFSEAELNALAQRKGRAYTPEQLKVYAEKGGAPHLDGDYTVFGEVVEGFDVIDKIAAVQTAPGDKPVTDIPMKVKVLK